MSKKKTASGRSDKVLLEAIGIERNFRDGTRVLNVLRGINLSVREGESVAITGASGVGKSTLLHLLAGLDRPTGGKILFDSTDLTGMSDEGLSQFCNRSMSIIFQFFNLLVEFSAFENVMMPGLIAGRPQHDLERSAAGLLEAVGLGDRLEHRPTKLSGGEQQRVAIARALINDPALILADEPTGNLDEETGKAVIDLLWKQTIGRGRTLIIVSHEPEIAARADSRYHLHAGKLEATQ